MRESLLSLLADPISKEPLRLAACGRKRDGDMVEGMLRGPERSCTVRAIAEEE